MSLRLLGAVLALSLLSACSSTDEVTFADAPGLDLRAGETTVDMAATRLTNALQQAGPVSIVADIDHAANASGAGLSLRPTRVVLFGNPALGTPIMQANQLAGIDLPQKMLVYEDEDGYAVVTYNTTDYLAARHAVGGVGTLGQIATALDGFAETAIGTSLAAERNAVSGRGEGEALVVGPSSADFERTYRQLIDAIEAAGPLSVIAELDHAANAQSVGLTLRPTRLVVFGNPAVGTPLMQAAPTFAIDLPQKMLVYEDAAGDVFVAYNDPFALAERHGARGLPQLQTIEDALQMLTQAATVPGD